jgi:hypothetical protein|tara:strand:- start:151 stop:318 length:168 start_codon:yes stop_codon:yes gene_type:complete
MQLRKSNDVECKYFQYDDIQLIIVKAMMSNVIEIFRADCEINDVGSKYFHALIFN